MRPDLPAEPLRRIIRQDLQVIEHGREDHDPSARTRWPGLSLLADQVKIDQRRLRAILNTQDGVSVNVADQYCLATGRHLADVYPELYESQPDAYVAECPGCGGLYADVAGEGKLRLVLRCRECGRRWHVDRYPERRSNKLGPQALTWDQLAQAQQLYEDGWSFDQLAEHYGVSPSNLHRWFVLLGVERRRRGPADWQAVIAYGRQVGRAKAWRRRCTALWLRARGLKLKVIAQRVGMTDAGVSYSIRMARRLPIVARYCTNPACAEYGQPYPLPPADVLDMAPELGDCPACSLRGDGLEDWWRLTA